MLQSVQKTNLLSLPQRLKGSKKIVLKIFILEFSRLRSKSNVFGQSAFIGNPNSNTNFKSGFPPGVRGNDRFLVSFSEVSSY
jgi:hypothetical protein